jgi:3-hydroxybutyryl-CoA dehydrogenase
MSKVVIIGAGMMGAGIAACSSLAGESTILVDTERSRVETGARRVVENIRQLSEAGVVNSEQANRASHLLQTDVDISTAITDADLIIEAITENLSAKQELFQKLDSIVDPSVIIASNTSGLRITDITRDVVHRERTATTHFWFPGHLVPLVEIVMSEYTTETTAETLRETLVRWGKAPVIVRKDFPGQLANRILQAVIREAINIVEIGLASPADVDTAIKAGMALRFPVWGPLEHIDAVGLDLALSVQRDVLPELRNETTPSDMLQALCAENKLGYKTGSGFYDWKKKDMSELAARRDEFIINTVQLLSSSRD